MAIDPKELRRALGHFATGVTVITCRGADGEAHGATVNAFTAVSLEPPLVLVSLDRRSTLCSLLEVQDRQRSGEHADRGAGPSDPAFTVNVLESAQKDLAMHFAGKPGPEVGWDLDSECGAPQLAGALAHISCTPWQHYDGGDHVLHLGEVQEFRIHDGQPLLFHTGKFHQLGEDDDPLLWDGSADGPGGMAWFSHAFVR